MRCAPPSLCCSASSESRRPSVPASRRSRGFPAPKAAPIHSPDPTQARPARPLRLDPRLRRRSWVPRRPRRWTPSQPAASARPLHASSHRRGPTRAAVAAGAVRLHVDRLRKGDRRVCGWRAVGASGGAALQARDGKGVEGCRAASRREARCSRAERHTDRSIRVGMLVGARRVCTCARRIQAVVRGR